MKIIPQPPLSRGKIKKKIKFTIGMFVFLFMFSCMVVSSGQANMLPDADQDGIPDRDEIGIYFTDPKKADTDGDGYSDWMELNQGFSPLVKEALKLEDSDADNDGLTDREELNFHTNLLNPDTDGDGFLDGDEVRYGYNPLNPDPVFLSKRIEINTGSQKISYFLGDVKRGEFIVSTGKASMPTPKGNYYIDGKSEKAWSASYGLWMPYWMSLQNGYFGIHELPEWPNGYKEGEDHLGTPVSHGCIRLGVGPAEFLYNWAPINTPVFIY